MAERKRVGLIFTYNENWIAGAYYIINIIHALNTLKDEKKPQIILFTGKEKDYEKVLYETQYPYLGFELYPKLVSYNLLEKIINKIFRLFFGKKVIKRKPKYVPVDFLYPYVIEDISKEVKKVNWIPDFQEDYLPQFFSKEEVIRRKLDQNVIAEKNDIVVFSSNDARNDFNRLYPEAKAVPFVLQFAVTHPDFSQENITELLKKYKLPNHYFFAPNQFWAHKNHIIILKAIKILKDEGLECVVAMSGKPNDYRNINNYKVLTNYIKENNLNDNVRLLGFLPRNEQLCLFKNSITIIQPSLFEGWSTVIEDAKALNKYVAVSNLDVHKEQINKNVTFFNPNNEKELADILKMLWLKPPEVIKNNYHENIVAFGRKFNELINI